MSNISADVESMEKDLKDFRTLENDEEKDQAYRRWLDFLTEVSHQPDKHDILVNYAEQLAGMVDHPEKLPLGIMSQIMAFHHIAQAYKDAKVNLKQAASHAQRSLDLLLTHGKDGRIELPNGRSVHFKVFDYKLFALNLTGQIHHLLGNRGQALSPINTCADAILEEFGKGFTVVPHGTANLQEIALDCAAVYEDTGDVEKAEQLYRQALCVSGGKNRKARRQWATLYEQKYHTNEGFDALVEETISWAVERYKKEILANTVDEVKPDFELDDVNGDRVRLSDLRGQVVVLGFGFHCGFCQIKLPYFQQASDRYKEKNGVSFLWIGDQSASVAELKEYVEQNGCSFRMFRDTGRYLDKQGVQWLYGVKGIPQVFVIDKQGHIRYKESGGISYDSDCEIDYSEALSWKIEALSAS